MDEDKKKSRTLVYALLGISAIAAVAVAAVIGFVIGTAVLFNIGILNPRNVTPTICTFPPGIACSSFKVGTDGSLDLAIGQATGKAITVTGISCTSGVPAESDFVQTNVMIPNGGQAAVSGAGAPATARCGTGGAAGEFSRWEIGIKYTESGTGIQRRVIGDMAAKYE